MLKKLHNSDILTCLANLSSDEVFTPPKLANQMLDSLPKEIWQDETVTFLDPVSKSGVFLREITKRLLDGLESKIPDLETRIDHILKKQVYGIGITELTALISRRTLYCSKYANGKYSIVHFEDKEGNVRYFESQHTWVDDKICKYCGVRKGIYQREKGLESYAYSFIHGDKPEELFNMKFDVVIGNPPYQMNDGGGSGTSAIPIYNKFVERAIKLDPRYISMIIPSRWFSGGKGLGGFRKKMISDRRLKEIHDYINAGDCFPGVQIKGGVCYFLWSRESGGKCKVSSYNNNNLISSKKRNLVEEGLDSFIRFNEAIAILKKIKKINGGTILEDVSYRNPYGIASNYKNFVLAKNDKNKIKLYRYGKVGYINSDSIPKNEALIKKIKVIISKAGSGSDAFPHQIIGKPIISEPGSVSTETYLILGVFNSMKEAKNFISYVKTRFFRFLVSLIKISQNAPREVYKFVPRQPLNEIWLDEKLYKKYSISADEINFIESMIRPLD